MRINLIKITCHIILKFYPLFVLYTSFYFITCSPIPIIQSARVTGRVGIGNSYTSKSHSIIIKQKDTCGVNVDSTGTRTLKYLINEQIEPRGFLRFGIKDRFELITTILPYPYPPFILLSGNIKRAIFDIGSDPLFHNISLALFIGGDYMPFEWDCYKNFWGGLIAGTHCPIKNSELELVFMTSGSYFSYYSTSDGYGNKDISFATANFSLGCIFRPTEHRFMEMNAGITGRIGFKKHLYADISNSNVISSEVTKFKINPVVFQCGLLLYIPRRKL